MKPHHLTAVFIALSAGSALAQLNTSTWDGGGNPDPSWSNGLNWVGDVPPTETGGTVNAANPDRNIVFAGTINLTSNQNLPNVGGGGFNIGDIRFDSSAGPFTLTNSTGTGLDMLGVRNTAVASSITNNSTSLQTLSIGLISRPDFTATLNFNAAAGDITVAGIISTGGAGAGNGGITKNGSGTLTLAAANTYSGPTVINAGNVSLRTATSLGATGAAPANTTVAGGASVSIDTATNTTFAEQLILNGATLNNNAQSNTWTGGITLGADSTISTATGSTLLISGVVSGAGGFTKTGTGTLALSGANTYGGVTNINAGNVSLRSGGALGAGGAGANTIVASTATLSIDTAAATTFGEALTLNGTTLSNNAQANTWSGAITLGADSTFSTAAGTSLNITGVVGGAGGLVKTGAGTLTLSAANTYTGVTTLNEGTLNAGNLANGGTASSIGASSAASSNLVFNGGTLRWTGGTPTAIDRGFTLGAGGGTFESVGAAFRFTGIVTGGGDLTKTGANTLAFSGANDYTGRTFVNESTLFLRTAASLGASGTAANGTVVANNAILSIDTGSVSGGSNVSSTFNEVLTLNGGTLNNNSQNNIWAGPITLGASSTVSAAAGTTLTVTGLVDGPGGLTKNLTGAVALTNANTYTGPTVISAGVLTANTLANGGTASSIGASSAASSNLVFDGGTLRWTGSTPTAIDRGFTLNAGGGTIESQNAALRFAGVVTGGGNFTKTGASSVAFSGANDYTGRTFVNAGTLFLRSSASLGAAGSATNDTTVASGAILSIDPGSAGGSNVDSTFNEVLTLNGGTLANNTRNNTWAGPVTLAATSNVSAVAGTSLTVSGPVDGAGGLTKADAGTVVLSGNNSYAGTTTVNAGTLRIASDTALGSPAAGTSVTNGAALELQGGITVTGEALTIGERGIGSSPISTGALRNLSGNNTFDGPISTRAGVQSRIQSDAGLLTLNGGITSLAIGGNTLNLSGAGNGVVNGDINNVFQLNKEGAGTWTLNGNVGVTTNNPTPADVNVNGGTLAGITSVVSRNTMVNPTAALSPGLNGGAGTGTFAVSGNLLFGAGSIANIQVATPDATFTDFAALAALTDPVVLAGTDDFISVGGALTTNAGSTVALDFTGYTPRIGDAFDLFDFTTGPAILPMFAVSGADFTGFSLDTSRFLSLGVVAIVPEPSRALLLLLGLMTLGRRRRR